MTAQVPRAVPGSGARALAATLEVLSQYDGRVTVRQVYYRLVSDPYSLFPNTKSRYIGFDKWLVQWREKGLIDWERFDDHSRSFSPGEDYASKGPRAFLQARVDGWTASTYHRSRWGDQEVVPEVWVEKDALKGVVSDSVAGLRVGVFASRGFSSMTKLKEAVERLTVCPHVVIYLSDHDPSGLGMETDLLAASRRVRRGGRCPHPHRPDDRAGAEAPPGPNPLKHADPRAKAYLAEFGEECWELDALPPKALRSLVHEAVSGFVEAACGPPRRGGRRRRDGGSRWLWTTPGTPSSRRLRDFPRTTRDRTAEAHRVIPERLVRGLFAVRPARRGAWPTAGRVGVHSSTPGRDHRRAARAPVQLMIIPSARRNLCASLDHRAGRGATSPGPPPRRRVPRVDVGRGDPRAPVGGAGRPPRPRAASGPRAVGNRRRRADDRTLPSHARGDRRPLRHRATVRCRRGPGPLYRRAVGLGRRVDAGPPARGHGVGREARARHDCGADQVRARAHHQARRTSAPGHVRARRGDPSSPRRSIGSGGTRWRSGSMSPRLRPESGTLPRNGPSRPLRRNHLV